MRKHRLAGIALSIALGCALMAQTAQAKTDLHYWGGQTLGRHAVHVIWWGTPARFQQTHRAHVMQLFRDASQAYRGQDNIYHRLLEYHSAPGNQAGVDQVGIGLPRVHNPDCPRLPRVCIGWDQLGSLWDKVFKARPGWTAKDLYLIMLPRGTGACFGDQCYNKSWDGAHSASYSSQGHIAWMITVDQRDSRSLDPILLHEHAEAITDPFPSLSPRPKQSGWQTRGGLEIADLCGGTNPKMRRIGKHFYLTPALWSNQHQDCRFN